MTILLVGEVSTSCSTTGSDEGKLSENVDSLMARLKVFNDKLPVTFASGNVLDSVYYDSGGNQAVFNLVINDGDGSGDVKIMFGGNDSNDRAKSVLVSGLEGNEEALSMYKELAEGGVSVRTVLMGSSGRNKIQVELSAEEVNAIKLSQKANTAVANKTHADSAIDSLTILVDSINALLPDTIDGKTMLTMVMVENNYLVYNYVREEGNNGTVDRLKRQLSTWKGSAESELRKPSPEMLTLMKLCVSNGLGMKHRYVGKDTKQTIDYSFSAVDLSKLCDQPLPEGYEEIKERIKRPKKVVIINE